MIDDAYIQALAEYLGITTDQVRSLGDDFAKAAANNCTLSHVARAAERFRRIAQLEQEVEELKLSLGQACTEPADYCECPGCMTADKNNGVER